MRTPHTYVVVTLSEDAYNEIASRLREAGCLEPFMENGEIDMHGIAISTEPPLPNARPFHNGRIQ